MLEILLFSHYHNKNSNKKQSIQFDNDKKLLVEYKDFQ